MSRAEALKWIANIFEEPVNQITPETSRDNIPAWDSLGVLTLMAGLDQEFGLLLSDAELRPMKSVQDILDVLKKGGKLSE
jgi:acyl carrier protein